MKILHNGQRSSLIWFTLTESSPTTRLPSSNPPSISEGQLWECEGRRDISSNRMRGIILIPWQKVGLISSSSPILSILNRFLITPHTHLSLSELIKSYPKRASRCTLVEKEIFILWEGPKKKGPINRTTVSIRLPTKRAPCPAGTTDVKYCRTL